MTIANITAAEQNKHRKPATHLTRPAQARIVSNPSSSVDAALPQQCPSQPEGSGRCRPFWPELGKNPVPVSPGLSKSTPARSSDTKVPASSMFSSAWSSWKALLVPSCASSSCKFRQQMRQQQQEPGRSRQCTLIKLQQPQMHFSKWLGCAV